MEPLSYVTPRGRKAHAVQESDAEAICGVAVHSALARKPLRNVEAFLQREDACRNCKRVLS